MKAPNGRAKLDEGAHNPDHRQGSGPIAVFPKTVMLRLTVGEHELLKQLGSRNTSASDVLRTLIRQEGKRLGYPTPPLPGEMKGSTVTCARCRKRRVDHVEQHTDGLAFTPLCKACAASPSSV